MSYVLRGFWHVDIYFNLNLDCSNRGLYRIDCKIDQMAGNAYILA